MSYTIAEFLIKNGYEINKDAIRVTPNTTFENDATRAHGEKWESLWIMNRPGGFYYDGQGVGMIAHPVTQEYYVSMNKDLIRAVAEEFKLPVEEDPNVSGIAYGMEFKDKKTQKLWEKHCEREDARARHEFIDQFEETELKMKRAKAREIAAGKVPLDAKGTVMDVVRHGGFVPEDYVPVKDGMVIYSNPDSKGDWEEIELHLPKEEEVSSKRYIIEKSGYFVIGNTDTNEAIVTCNPELKKEFEGEGYRDEHYDTLNVEGITFKDKQVQNRWEKHQHRQNKQFALIRAQSLKYVKQHLSELKREAELERSAYPFAQSADIIINDLAEKHVLKERRIARYKTRNMTTTRHDYVPDVMILRLKEKHAEKGIAHKKEKEAVKEQPVEPAPQEKPVSAPLLKRFFKRSTR